ncbi:MAG TPA: hypothetical protein VKF84_00045 [Candidatus Sulfotelmatobacter sp.]|nr:hypothetical protein [Candidatus Sulfotelmatobacter sp.]
MPTKYDADVLQSYADDLYNQAQRIIFQTTISYGLITFLVSALLSGVVFAYIAHEYQTNEGDPLIFSVLIFTVLGIAVGMSEGRRKAFRLKLEAQELLCQRQIELNTRTLPQGNQTSKPPNNIQ